MNMRLSLRRLVAIVQDESRSAALLLFHLPRTVGTTMVLQRVALLVSFGLALTPASAGERPDLNWLAGHWCSTSGDRSIEEHWLAERGGLMLGVNRTVVRGTASFEFLRIVIDGGGARYIAQPGGAPPTTFTLVSATLNSVVFANPQHDFPKRVQYRREGATLSARVDDGSENGSSEEFLWRRCEEFGSGVSR